MNWWTIGSLTVPASQIAMVIAFLLAALILWLKKERLMLDVYGNAVFVFIFTWKLSILLFNFSIVKQTPLSLLYFNGGWKGVWLGAALALMYLAWRCPREKYMLAAWVWMLVLIVFGMADSLLTGQAGVLAFLQFAGGVALLAIPRREAGRTVWLLTLWQLLFMSLADELFSPSSLLYVSVACFFTFIGRRKHVG
ncbi:hypothetical protein [Bacillus thermotolerans]|uniref:Uncharacterized protein n=1 Tax=Bacillus thermotolerans TaxID=1221996 RepID=A0A0F5I0B0_BACTR|nr:hypothetical protein [Bacillus thermotolerans]KKB38705.1 hypothetical protein QY97_01809 [Bacillus thermotolerans]KKB41445.1 hypothetical protein QY95_00764 [Bacillus thermotolerans]KKB43996.1 hypothetical protein QY96_00188 [Bacillus thermotolerans]